MFGRAAALGTPQRRLDLGLRVPGLRSGTKPLQITDSLALRGSGARGHQGWRVTVSGPNDPDQGGDRLGPMDAISWHPAIAGGFFIFAAAVAVGLGWWASKGYEDDDEE